MSSKLKVIGCKYKKECPQDKGKSKIYTCCCYCDIVGGCPADCEREQCNVVPDECSGVVAISEVDEKVQQFMEIFTKRYTGFYVEEDEYSYIHYPEWAIKDAITLWLNGEFE